MVLRPGSFGKFYSPEEVAHRLTTIAYKKGFRQVRIGEIDEDFREFEVEELTLYGKVEERLIRAGLRYDTAHEQTFMPPDQV